MAGVQSARNRTGSLNYKEVYLERSTRQTIRHRKSKKSNSRDFWRRLFVRKGNLETILLPILAVIHRPVDRRDYHCHFECGYSGCLGRFLP